MTLRTWIITYLDSYKKDIIKSHSYEVLLLSSRKIPDELQNMELDEIKPMHLQRFLNAFSVSASKSYMDKVYTLLHSAFDAAVDNDFCEKNPAHRLKMPYVKEQTRESFSLDEVRILIPFAASYPNRRIGTAILTLLLTGIRRGELLGLKASDITAESLSIHRAVYLEKNQIQVSENEAKTESSLRTIPIFPELAYLLKTLPHKGEYLFSTASGSILHPRNINRDYDRFFRVMQESEPSVRRLSPHCCRHTYATLMLETSGNIRIVQELLGHTDIKTTARYSHPDMQSLKHAVTDLKSAIL